MSLRTCDKCKAEFTPRSARSRQQYCDTCLPADATKSQRANFYAAESYKRLKAGKPPKNRMPSRINGQNPVETLSLVHTELRLRVEAAKPLLRIALEHDRWDLVQEALNELEGKSDGRIIDVRQRADLQVMAS